MRTIQIIKCDFDNVLHCNAVVDLMRDYMTDKMGDTTPLTGTQNQMLIQGLKDHPRILTLLAKFNSQFVGLTNSFVNFSSFSVHNFLSIHDVIVNENFRRLGIGKMLLEENTRIAIAEFDCAKICLEVRHDNLNAQQLYQSLGFKDCNPPMFFWQKALL